MSRPTPVPDPAPSAEPRRVPIPPAAAERMAALLSARAQAETAFAVADQAARVYVEGLATGMGLAFSEVSGVDEASGELLLKSLE